MRRPDPWGYLLLGFLAGILVTTIAGAWAVPKVHAAIERRVASFEQPAVTAYEAPTAVHYWRRCAEAVETLSEDLEGVQVPRYEEGP